MEDNLKYQFELLRSSYIDEHEFIKERIFHYQKHANEDNENDSNTANWIRILQNEYPPLIEKISTDFNVKIPSIETTLSKMLMNTKNTLLKRHMKLR